MVGSVMEVSVSKRAVLPVQVLVTLALLLTLLLITHTLPTIKHQPAATSVSLLYSYKHQKVLGVFPSGRNVSLIKKDSIS